MSFIYPTNRNVSFSELLMKVNNYLLDAILDTSNNLIGNVCTSKFCLHDDCFHKIQQAGDKFTPNELRNIEYHKFNIEILNILSVLKAYEAYSVYEEVVEKLKEKLIKFLQEFSKKHGKIRYIIDVGSDYTKYIYLEVYYNQSLCDKSCEKFHKEEYGEVRDYFLKTIKDDLQNEKTLCRNYNKLNVSISDIKSQNISCDTCNELTKLICNTMNNYYKNIKEDIKNLNPEIYEYYITYEQNDKIKTFDDLITYFKTYFNRQLLNDSDYNDFKNSNVYKNFDENILTFEQFMKNSYHINLHNNYINNFNNSINNQIFNIYIHDNLIYLYTNKKKTDILIKSVECHTCNLPINEIYTLTTMTKEIYNCNKCLHQKLIINIVYDIIKNKLIDLICKYSNYTYDEQIIINLIKQEISNLTLEQIKYNEFLTNRINTTLKIFNRN